MLAAGLIVLLFGSVGFGLLTAWVQIHHGIVAATAVLVFGVVITTAVASSLILAGTT